MYKEKKICVVVPAFNEERLIAQVIETMPSFVDLIIVVNDASTDKTKNIVEKMESDLAGRLKLLNHVTNQGVGGAIATGYKHARDHQFDVAVVMAGDAQMDPHDLPSLLDPVVNGKADYSKGNRLITGHAFQKIPKVRYFGNAALSMLTKIASGYWHVADSQTGYTAINKRGLNAIDWDGMYKKYGQPNDLLVSCNINKLRVIDVPVEPVYGVGEKSGIKIKKVLFGLSFLLSKLFLKRLLQKYVVRDFHPLVLFYFFGGFLFVFSLPLAVRMLFVYLEVGLVPKVNLIAFLFVVTMSLQFILFAMWFDMEDNRSLCVKDLYNDDK